MGQIIVHILYDVATDNITLQVNLVPDLQLAQIGMFARVGDKRDGETVGQAFDYCQAHAIDGDKAFGDHIGGQMGGKSYLNLQADPVWFECEDWCGSLDMALHGGSVSRRVRRCVSGIVSTRNQFSPWSVTVRQMPSTATLSFTPMSVRMCSAWITSPVVSLCSNVPISSIIPVNIVFYPFLSRRSIDEPHIHSSIVSFYLNGIVTPLCMEAQQFECLCQLYRIACTFASAWNTRLGLELVLWTHNTEDYGYMGIQGATLDTLSRSIADHDVVARLALHHVAKTDERMVVVAA